VRKEVNHSYNFEAKEACLLGSIDIGHNYFYGWRCVVGIHGVCMMKVRWVIALMMLGAMATVGSEKTPGYNSDRNAYFGDLHVHTQNSSDAFIFNVRATPDDAYRYSRGEAIKHPLGFPISLRSGALDFTAVTDHGELLGILPAMIDPNSPMSELAQARGIQSSDRATVLKAFYAIARSARELGNASPLRNPDVIRSAWDETIASAERNNSPGVFTTFSGYEYTAAPKSQNLHRNVIFRSSAVPDMPFSSVDSGNPEDLWHWLDQIRAKGMEALAIPHNSNVRNGLMFPATNWAGAELDANYAALRMRNEPLVEITQVKGTSETHPSLSPNDEWAGFELYDTLIATEIVAKKPGGFVREAYRNGLVWQSKNGSNPYKFGLIGSSDTHNAGGPVEENNYFSKAGILDGTAERRGSVPSRLQNKFGAVDANKTFPFWSASGLVGIWAEENTRGALYDAMRRKETFATSGPRIKLRFFAGPSYKKSLLADPNMIQKAYSGGVPMGSDLSLGDGGSPSFLVWASFDSYSTRLQRIQIIKGWVTGGESFEQVFDVACSDGLRPNGKTHRCPDNAASVNLDDCSVSADKGAVELKTLWQDPTFKREQEAFYYVRVLENPSCRWSSWDALRAGVPPMKGQDATLQERAWSSPIWVSSNS